MQMGFAHQLWLIIVQTWSASVQVWCEMHGATLYSTAVLFGRKSSFPAVHVELHINYAILSAHSKGLYWLKQCSDGMAVGLG